MLQNILEAGISNVIVASCMAFVILGITRIWKNPHVAHLLWLLVLIKLISPPLWHISIPFTYVSSHFTTSDESENLALNENQSNLVQPEPLKLEEIDSLSDKFAAPILDASLTQFNDPVFAEQGSKIVPTDQHNPLPLDTGVIPQPDHRESSPSFVSNIRHQISLWWKIPAFLWISGTILWLIILSFRIFRFHRLIRQTLPATDELNSVAELIAKNFSLRRLPEMRLTEAVVSPMVWPVAYPPTVVLPKQLVDQLNRHQLATILAHEFAHLRRLDHWVRFLEVIVASLYWWNPIMGWVRRELRASEEACCDALVLRLYPDQVTDYGEALLRTNEFIKSGQNPSPVLASGFGHSCSLKRRVEMILKNEFGKPASPVVKILILAIALGVLPMAARIALAQKNETSPTINTNPEVDKGELLPKPKSATIRVSPMGYIIESGGEIKVRPFGESIDATDKMEDDENTSGGYRKHHQNKQPHQNKSNSLEQRVDRMESLLKQLIAAQSSKKVPTQNKSKKTQVPHLPDFKYPATPSPKGRSGLSVTLPSMGSPPLQPRSANPSWNISWDLSRKSWSSIKEIQGIGNPAAVKKIVDRLQDKTKDLIFNKSNDISRLSKELEQLAANVKQIDELKAALKKAEEARGQVLKKQAEFQIRSQELKQLLENFREMEELKANLKKTEDAKQKAKLKKPNKKSEY